MNETHPLVRVTRWAQLAEQANEYLEGATHLHAARIIRDGIPESAVVVSSMTFHPDDFQEAKISLGDEIEAQLFRSTFSATQIFASEHVPRDHVLLQDATGALRELKRFR